MGLIGKKAGQQVSIPFLSATPPSCSWTLEDFFELTQCPASLALNLGSCVASRGPAEIKGTVRCSTLGAVVPGKDNLKDNTV